MPIPPNPVPIYPFVPIEKETAACLASPGKDTFAVQVLAIWSNSQKSVWLTPLPNPHPTYPFEPIEKPDKPSLPSPGYGVFTVQLSVEGSYS